MSKLGEVLGQRMADLLTGKKEIKTFEDVQAIANIFNDLPDETKAKIVDKAAELMNTFEQATWVYEKAPSRSALKQKALSVMIKLGG